VSAAATSPSSTARLALPAFLQPAPGVDQVEVVDVASGEVVLFWDVGSLEAKRFVRELRADLLALETDELLARWGAVDAP
jgi:hypothetical protein